MLASWKGYGSIGGHGFFGLKNSTQGKTIKHFLKLLGVVSQSMCIFVLLDGRR